MMDTIRDVAIVECEQHPGRFPRPRGVEVAGTRITQADVEAGRKHAPRWKEPRSREAAPWVCRFTNAHGEPLGGASVHESRFTGAEVGTLTYAGVHAVKATFPTSATCEAGVRADSPKRGSQLHCYATGQPHPAQVMPAPRMPLLSGEGPSFEELRRLADVEELALMRSAIGDLEKGQLALVQRRIKERRKAIVEELPSWATGFHVTGRLGSR